MSGLRRIAPVDTEPMRVFVDTFNQATLSPGARLFAELNLKTLCVEVALLVQVQNVDDPEQRGPVKEGDILDDGWFYERRNRPTSDQVTEVARVLWRRLQDHEFEEWLRVGGSYRFDPHGNRNHEEPTT